MAVSVAARLSYQTAGSDPDARVVPMTMAGMLNSSRTATRRSLSCRSTMITPSTRRCAHHVRYMAISASWSSATVNKSVTWLPDSSAWMPEMSCMKYGSMPSSRAGLSMTSPKAPARPSDRARAALLGWNPTSAAMARIRSRVAADTPGWLLRANDTAAFVTPARLATSAIVGRFTVCPFHRPHAGATMSVPAVPPPASRSVYPRRSPSPGYEISPPPRTLPAWSIHPALPGSIHPAGLSSRHPVPGRMRGGLLHTVNPAGKKLILNRYGIPIALAAEPAAALSRGVAHPAVLEEPGLSSDHASPPTRRTATAARHRLERAEIPAPGRFLPGRAPAFLAAAALAFAVSEVALAAGRAVG
jgi:hypothetical protein